MTTENLINAIYGDNAKCKDDEMSHILLERQIYYILMTLPYRESLVLQLSYGLLNNQMHTLSKIGKQLGVTRERVRQIREAGLSRFHQPLKLRHMRPYIDFAKKEQE